MAVPFFDLTRQNNALKKELAGAISAVVESGKFILGDYVVSLEKAVAEYCGVRHAIGVASGTDALHLSLRACGIGPGDEVITSPFTFVATADAIAYCGATPVFVDIDLATYNLDPARLAERINKKTKAIIPVHLYGQPCEMGKLMAVAQKHGLKVIEDCAQAIGAEFSGKKVGSFGDTGCFSFFPTKNLGCFGDGGVITTNNDHLAEEIKVLRGHGSRKTYHYDLIGYNSRLDALQAQIIQVKLAKLDVFSHKRKENARFYWEQLGGINELTLPCELPSVKHVFNQFTVRVKGRDQLLDHLKKKGVGAMVYYPLSLHLQKAFAGLGYKVGDLPACETAQAEVLSLPIFPELTTEERQEVVNAVRSFFN